MGVRGRMRISSAGRKASILRSASSSSFPQWAMQQHQELLAARDMEAMQKLAAGGTEDFINYATERIAALAGTPQGDHWKELLKDAQAKQQTTKTNNLVSQYAAQLQSGEITGDKYMAFLQGELGKYAPGSTEHTNLVTHMADAKKWIDLQTRTLEKRHDEEMSASVQSGETKLEDALDYYKGRRDQLHPGDEAYATLTKHISDIQNGIQARDFNAQINTAHAKLIEASKADPIAAKKDYQATLVKLMNSARDPAAQQKLYDQVTALDQSIKKDEQLKDAQVTNEKMVSYFANKSDSPNASEMYQFLAQKAHDATDPAEAAKYTTMASQITAHEAAKIKAVGAGGGAGAGFTVAATSRAIGGFKNAYETALDTVQRKIDRGITPTSSDWAILKQARDNYSNVAQQAYDQGNLDTKNAMNTLVDKIKGEAGPPTVEQNGGQGGWDFGKVGDAMANKLVADVKTTSDEITRAAGKGGDPEMLMQAIGKHVGEIQKAMGSPFTQQDPKAQTALNELDQTAHARVAGLIADAKTTLSGKPGSPIAQLNEHFKAFLEGGGGSTLTGATPAQKFGQWLTALTKATDASQFSGAVGGNVTGTQLASLQALVTKDKTEQQGARDQLVAAIAHRNADGVITPGSTPGGANGMDESDVLARLNGLMTGTAKVVDSPSSPQGANYPQHGGLAGPSGVMGASAFDQGGASAGGKMASPVVPQPEAASGGAMLDSGNGETAGAAPATDVVTPGEGAVSPAAAAAMMPSDNAAQQDTASSMFAVAGGQLGPNDQIQSALDSGFIESDPHGAAWAFLNSPIDMSMPTFTMPDLPYEPTFLPNDTGSYDFGTFGGNTLTSGDESGPSGFPQFDVPSTSFDFPSGGGADSGEAVSGPTLSM